MLLYPDPLLKRVCEPVDLRSGLALAEDLVETMRAHPGCSGLAAPQVGEAVRVAVVDVSGRPTATAGNGLLVLVNPTVVARSESGELGREGCLSLPAILADVRRARRIVVTTDRPGGESTIWSLGFEARAVQHELDHLDGLLILDRAASAHAIHLR